MKRILIGLSLFAAACSGSLPTSPSGSSTVQSLPNASAPTPSDAEFVNPVDPTPPAPGANAPTPQYTLTGPRDSQNCFTAGTSPMQWLLNVTDAGPRALRFVALAHHDDEPGCEATIKNPRSRLEIGGVTNYTPHSSGQTTLTFNPLMYTCGRVQIDVSIVDSAGNEILIIGVVIKYGTVCTPTSQPPVCVAPAGGPFRVGTPVTFTVANAVPGAEYQWSAPLGSPAAGTGTSFTTTLTVAGTLTVTLTSGGVNYSGSACTAIFEVRTVTEPRCVAAATNPLPAPGVPLTYNIADPEAGVTYSWAVTPAGATPASGSGVTFTTSFPAPPPGTTVTYSITPSAPGIPGTACTVVIHAPDVPYCAASPTNPAPPRAGVPFTFNVANPVAGVTYSWAVTPAGATPPSGSGTTFTTSFAGPAPGSGPITYTIALSAPGQTSLTPCTVVIPSSTIPPICVPSPTNPLPAAGVPFTFTVSNAQPGVTYSWTVTPVGATPASGTGTAFTTTFAGGAASITYTVMPSAPGAGPGTACGITIPPPPPLPPPICAASPTNPTPPAAGLPFTFNVSNAQAGVTYSWTVTPVGATPASGTGTAFTTTFAGGAAAITYLVTPSAPGAGPGTGCSITIPGTTAPICLAEPYNPPPRAGVRLAFTVFNTVPGVTYTWVVTPVGGTPATGTGPNFETVLAGPPVGSPPITYLITPSIPGGPGTACTVVIPAPDGVCPPTTNSFTASFPLGGVFGRAIVNGPGVWVAHLFAATTYEKYLADLPDVEKDTKTVTLVCPSPTTPVGAVIDVTYPWGGHPDRFWWMTLELNGVRLYKSGAAVNTP